MPATGPLRVALLGVIAVGLVLIGGGAAVALGVGQGQPAPGPGSVEAGFARDMSRHHLQGVEMANLALERSIDPEVSRLAFDIAETQQNQVGRMQGWLSLWGLPPTGGEVMAWLGAGGHAGHDPAAGSGAPMPGMAAEEELAELRALSGTEFDVLFLRLMIRHHQGGFDMAQYGAEHASVPAVAGLADTIADSQTAEVTTMERMLIARGGTPPPPP